MILLPCWQQNTGTTHFLPGRGRRTEAALLWIAVGTHWQQHHVHEAGLDLKRRKIAIGLNFFFQEKLCILTYMIKDSMCFIVSCIFNSNEQLEYFLFTWEIKLPHGKLKILFKIPLKIFSNICSDQSIETAQRGSFKHLFMGLKFIMVLFQKFQHWKSRKSYMEKFTGQIQQNYLCLYRKSILNVKFWCFFFFP